MCASILHPVFVAGKVSTAPPDISGLLAKTFLVVIMI